MRFLVTSVRSIFPGFIARSVVIVLWSARLLLVKGEKIGPGPRTWYPGGQIDSCLKDRNINKNLTNKT